MKNLIFLSAIALTLSTNRISAQKQPAAPETPLRIIAFGAHPDDAELRTGGMATLWAAKGYKVKIVSMTNGDIGHFSSSGGALANRRLEEVRELLKGNPVYEAGGTVEIRELPRV